MRIRPTAVTPKIEALGVALPLVVKNMRKLAIDPRAWTRECLKAIDLLTRVAVGPSNRPLDDMNVAAGREAALIRSRSVKRRRLPVLVERPLKIETPGKNARPVDTVEKFKNEPSHPMPVLIVCSMSKMGNQTLVVAVV